MKTIVRLGLGVTAAVSLLAWTQARASLLGLDTFSYPDGDIPLTAVPGGWTNYSGTTSLLITNIAGNGWANPMGTRSHDDGLILTSPVASNGIAFAGLDLVVLSWSASQSAYIVHFKDDGTFNFRARLMITNDSGNVRLGIANAASAATNAGIGWWPTTLSIGSTNRVVIEYDQSGVLPVATLWINPISQGSPSVSASDTIPSPVFVPITQFAILQSNSSQGNALVDNLIVGTTFSDVVVIPEPSTVLLVGAGLLGLVTLRRHRK